MCKVLLSVPTSLMRCGSVLGVNTGVFLIWNDFWLPKGFYSMSSLLTEIVKMPLLHLQQNKAKRNYALLRHLASKAFIQLSTRPAQLNSEL